MDKGTQGTPLSHRIGFILSIGIGAKLFVDTNVQLFYPFLTVIAAGIGINAVVMGRFVALRSMVGLTAPYFGSLADRIGHKKVMRISLLATGAGMILIPLSGNLPLLALGMVLSGLGAAAYVPNLHAYLSSRLPYEKRAWGLGVVEYSWALAGIIGLFVSGFLIENWSWKMPFFLIGSVLLLTSFMHGLLPDSIRDREKEDHRTPTGIRDFFHLGDHASSAWGCIILSGLGMFAMLHLMIIHGGWLQTEYGFSPSQLGRVALLLGVFDLTASVLVSLIVDRIGKRKSVLIGYSGMAVSFAVFPLLNTGLISALTGLMLCRGFCEFSIVSNFPLLSEQAPRHRGKVMSLNMTAGLIGTTVAGFTSPSAYLRFGVWGLGPVSLAVSVAALLIIIFAVPERRR